MSTKKHAELVYSRQRTGFEVGRRYANPRFFTSPRHDVSAVIVVGHYPEIVRAYEALGVPVQVVALPPVADNPPVQGPSPAPTDPSAVDIPEDWETLGWNPLRALARGLTAEPVKNKDEAQAVIRAELIRRAEAQAAAAGGDGAGTEEGAEAADDEADDADDDEAGSGGEEPAAT